MPNRGCVLRHCFIKLIRPAPPGLTDNADSSRSPVAPPSYLPITMETYDEAMKAFFATLLESADNIMLERLKKMAQLGEEEEGKSGMSHLATFLQFFHLYLIEFGNNTLSLNVVSSH